jgi:hypothetical protein
MVGGSSDILPTPTNPGKNTAAKSPDSLTHRVQAQLDWILSLLMIHNLRQSVSISDVARDQREVHLLSVSLTFYGSMTNNNEFWVGWLDFVTVYFTITRNHNHLQELIINLYPNSSFLDCPRLAPFSFRFHDLPFYDLILFYVYHLYSLEADPKKTQILLSRLRVYWFVT